MVDVSFGFSTYENQIPWGPALLVPFAERVKREADIPTSTTWNIGTSKLADDVIRQERIDVACLAGRSCRTRTGRTRPLVNWGATQRIGRCPRRMAIGWSVTALRGVDLTYRAIGVLCADRWRLVWPMALWALRQSEIIEVEIAT